MGVPVFASENTELTFAFNFKMKVVNIAYAMIKLQFKLPQTLISWGFTRRTIFACPCF